MLFMTATSCADRKPQSVNPFFEEWTTPFGVPPFDKILPEHYMPACERAMATHMAEIEAITSNNDEPTFENTILAYDNSGLMLEQVRLVFDMLCSAELTEQMAAVQEQVAPLLSAHDDRILLNGDLFARIKAVYDRRHMLSMDAEQMRLVEKIYDDFVRAGALLSPEQKKRLAQINGELALLSVKFGNNVLAENNKFSLELNKEELDGIPAGVQDAALERARNAGLKDKYLFTLDESSRIPFLTYSERRDLREKVYKAYIERGNHDDEFDNKSIVSDVARLRNEKARLLGYPDYASYSISAQMAGTPERVYALLDEIWDPALERAKEDMAEMEKLLRKDVPEANFEAWDWWYYANKLRRNKYAFDEEAMRAYFSKESVMSGIFYLANRLYGVTFAPVVVPTYHKDCMAYEVFDADDKHLGILYFDLFPRSTKSGGGWCGCFRPQRYDANGVRIAPVVSIVCNFTAPTKTMPALFSLEETETLFHEFGHALHSLFADVKYRGLSEVEGDFVELPSQIMENWAFEPEMLRQYAFHFRSGEVIPNRMIRQIRENAKFNQGFITTEIVAAALIDLDLHSISDYKPFDVNEFEKNALYERRGLIPQIAPRYRYPYFLHIFSIFDGMYSAGYYFYLWAEVLDKDAFQAFKESGDIFNREVARKFRRLLSRGGSADGMTLYRQFRGSDPDQRAMLVGRGLIEEEPEIVESADSLKPDLSDPRLRRRMQLSGKDEVLDRKGIQGKVQEDVKPQKFSKKIQ